MSAEDSTAAAALQTVRGLLESAAAEMGPEGSAQISDGWAHHCARL